MDSYLMIYNQTQDDLESIECYGYDNYQLSGADDIYNVVYKHQITK